MHDDITQKITILKIKRINKIEFKSTQLSQHAVVY